MYLDSAFTNNVEDEIGLYHQHAISRFPQLGMLWNSSEIWMRRQVPDSLINPL